MFGGFSMERKVNKLDKCHIEVVVTPAAEEWKAAQDKAFKAYTSRRELIKV